MKNIHFHRNIVFRSTCAWIFLQKSIKFQTSVHLNKMLRALNDIPGKYEEVYKNNSNPVHFKN